MRRIIFLVFGSVILISAGCVPFGKLTRHDFDSGFYKLKVKGADPYPVYAEIIEDSVIVYPVTSEGKNEIPNTSSSMGIKVSRVNADSYFYRSCFTNSSLDVDLTSILFKYRHSGDDIPNQFNADLNFAVYAGFRKDFYKIISPAHRIHEEKSFIRQIGFDFGLFAGIGSSAVNPTVTNNRINQQYDAMIFQKGVAGFISVNRMSLGLAVGFDNLLDKNKSSWIYNQSPYLGLIISVSNF